MRRRWFRSFLTCFAMYVIALQPILTGFASIPAAASFDPIAVICHSNAAADTSSADTQAPTGKHTCCDFCVLCHATPHANPPATVTLVEFVTPLRLDPATPDRRPVPQFIASHLPARGPPSTV